MWACGFMVVVVVVVGGGLRAARPFCFDCRFPCTWESVAGREEEGGCEGEERREAADGAVERKRVADLSMRGGMRFSPLIGATCIAEELVGGSNKGSVEGANVWRARGERDGQEKSRVGRCAGDMDTDREEQAVYTMPYTRARTHTHTHARTHTHTHTHTHISTRACARHAGVGA